MDLHFHITNFVSFHITRKIDRRNICNSNSSSTELQVFIIGTAKVILQKIGLKNSSSFETLKFCTYLKPTITRNVLLSAQMGERASVVLICNTHTSRCNEVK